MEMTLHSLLSKHIWAPENGCDLTKMIVIQKWDILAVSFHTNCGGD